MTPTTVVNHSATPPSHWPTPLLIINPHSLPPLPTSTAPKLAEQALLHKSSLVRPHEDNSQAELASNKRLEWVGDAALHFLVSRALEIQLPSASSGDLSRVRQYLTSNRTFAHLGAYYGLAAQLTTGQVGRDQLPWVEELKVVADTFEAVIGAVVCAGGFDMGALATAWEFVRHLVSPAVFPELQLLHDYTSARASYLDPRTGTLPTRLEDLLTSVASSGSSPPPPPESANLHVFQDIPTPQRGWTTTFYIGSTPVATGAGKNKLAARDDAIRAYLDTSSSPAPSSSPLP